MKGATSYRHGGFQPSDWSTLATAERTVLDFSVNLNPLGPPPLIREKWSQLFREIEAYPSLEGEGVAWYCERRYGVLPERFVAGSGSTEMIYLIPRVLGFKRAVVLAPSYHDYERACSLAGASVRHCFLLHHGKSFSLDKPRLREMMQDCDALWLGNPNNPTGNLIERETIWEISRLFPDRWIVVDEAFMPFVEEREEFTLLSAPLPENVLVLISLTKFYALAGLRLGGLVASEDVARRIRLFKEPWTVNRVAEKIAPLLLKCGHYEAETLSLIRQERARLVEALRQIDGVLAVPGAANFILCRWLLRDGLDDLQRHFLSHGIYVRDCRNFTGLDEKWFRLAVRTADENDRLVSALASFARRDA